MTMGERIKKVRKENNLTQQALADKIGTTQNSIARYEMNKITPSNAVISLICRTFRVREEWLREGIEPMFRKPSGNAEQVREWLDGIFEKGSRFEQSFMTAMSHFTDKEWGILERFLIDLKAEQEAEDAAEKAKPPAPAEASARFTEEELAVYRKVRDAMEKEAEARGEKPAVPPKPDGLTDEEKEILRQLRLEKSTKTSAASPSIA